MNPPTDTSERGLEDLIVAAMTASAWLTDTMFGLIYDRLASGIGDAAASLG